jgi:Periplasmic lysozyme inhibitor of I-type lysozyme
MKAVCGVTLILLPALSFNAAAQERFVSKLKHPTGQTVVVAEGDFEARSVGSFSIRLYEAAEPPDETTFFSAGIVRARDGVVDKVVLADVDGDERQEVVVVVRSAGTGNYLSAQAFAVARNELVFRAAVDGLAAGADPVAALRGVKTP